MKNTQSDEADLGRFRGDTFWGKVNMKLKKLATAIEMYKGGSMSMDDIEYRWVDDRINYLEREGRKLTKEEMAQLDEVSAMPVPYPAWMHSLGDDRLPGTARDLAAMLKKSDST